MIVTRTKKITTRINLEWEKLRINKMRIRSEYKTLLLNMLLAVEAKDYTRATLLYDALPENKDYECPLQEFVGPWWDMIHDNFHFSVPPTEETSCILSSSTEISFDD